jgi:hypothetical protein
MFGEKKCDSTEKNFSNDTVTCHITRIAVDADGKTVGDSCKPQPAFCITSGRTDRYNK